MIKHIIFGLNNVLLDNIAIEPEELNKLTVDFDLRHFILYRLMEDGFKLSCCSNSTRNTLVLALHRLGIKHCFKSLISNDDVKESKPSPEGYYRCILQTGIWVPHTMVIENSLVGAEAIQRSGCKVYIVNNRKSLTYDGIVNATNLY